MFRAIKVRNVLVCQESLPGAKYPFRIKVLEKGEARLDENRTVETVDVKAFNSLVQVPTGPQLLVVEGGVMTERVGREIKSVSEWERVEAVVPPNTPVEKLKEMLSASLRTTQKKAEPEAKPEGRAQ